MLIIVLFHIVVPRLSKANIILTLLMLQTKITMQHHGNICNMKDVKWGLCDKYMEESRESKRYCSGIRHTK